MINAFYLDHNYDGKNRSGHVPSCHAKDKVRCIESVMTKCI